MKKQLLVLSAAAMVAAAAVPAMADTTLYGSARMAAFYNIQDAKTTGTTGKTFGFDEHLQGNSRFGANFSNGDVGGKVEMGVNGTTRLLYGTWNFGSGKLTAGQDYNSYYTFVAQTHGDDNGFNGYGALWDGRQAQVRVNFTNGLYIAAITPYKNTNAVINPVAGTANATGVGTGNSEAAANNKQYIPKLNVGYAGKSGAVTYNTGLVGHYYKDETNSENVTALLGYLNGSAAFGNTSVMANVSYAQNAGNLGFAGREDFAKVGTSFEDAMGFEGYVQLTQKLSDKVKVNAGVGYVNDKRDNQTADDKMSVFVNAPIVLAKGVTLTPELSYYDEMKSTANKDQAKSYAVGTQLRIDF